LTARVGKTELVRLEQITKSYELCIFPTDAVDIDTSFLKGHAKVLYMNNPVQEIIIGNMLLDKGSSRTTVQSSQSDRSVRGK